MPGLLAPTLALLAALVDDDGARQGAQDPVYREDRLEAGFLEDPAALQQRRADWNFNATTFTSWLPGTDFSDDPGELETVRGGVSIGATKPLDRKRRLSIGLSHERSAYDFEDSSFLALETPLDEGSVTALSVAFITREAEDLRWSLSTAVRAGMEDGAELADAVVWSGGGTITFPLFDEALITLGGFVTSRLEDDPLFVPWFQLEWQITERLRLGREGGGVGLGYRLASDVHTYGSFSFDVRQFRLDDDGVFPEAVVRDDELGFNFGAVWTPAAATRVEGFAGVTRREITLLDDGVRLERQELELAPRFGLSASWRF